VVVIHGKRLQSIGFVTSILPYIFFTWWVNVERYTIFGGAFNHYI